MAWRQSSNCRRKSFTFRAVASLPDFPAQELDVLVQWRERRTFARLRAQNAGGPTWSFLDGPITANNPMGVHHAWGRAYKDLYQRYHAMLGHDQRWQNGFDCQGLWVEVNVERDLGFTSKHDIEAFGTVATVMDYDDLDEAIALARRGKGSLVASVFTDDKAVTEEAVLGLAPFHGRMLIGNRRSARSSTGHGSPRGFHSRASSHH